MLTVYCDVLQADGGTRTAAITGTYIAIALALDKMIRAKEVAPRALKTAVAAVSAGIVGGEPMLDLSYAEDSHAEVDFNVVMTGEGDFVEVQGTGEGSTFSRRQMEILLNLAQKGKWGSVPQKACEIRRLHLSGRVEGQRTRRAHHNPNDN